MAREMSVTNKYNHDLKAIPDSAYVSVTKDGHLGLEGKRVRFWGIIGAYIRDWRWPGPDPKASPAKQQKQIDGRRRDLVAMADRIVDMGFNMHRLWYAPSMSPQYRVGDGSRDDMLGFFLNELDKRGVYIWNSASNVFSVAPEDVDIIDDPSTAAEWKAAVKELQKRDGTISTRGLRARIWDPRLEALLIGNRKRILNWRNPYKNNLRWADDPQNAVWELTNEEWWLKSMLNGEWQDLPKFFQRELFQQWNGFLKKKYRTNDAICSAWLGLIKGESLDDGTIQLLPLKTENPSIVTPNDTNPAVHKLLNRTAKGLGRDQFNRRRGEDVLEFLTGIQIAHKQREYKALKPYGRSTKISPCVLDTGEGYHIQSLYMHQFGDATAMCTYMSGFHHDSSHKRFPWVSGLEELPRLCANVPWAESNRIPGKPFFLYETGFENPAKYRAEYPYRLTSLAVIQDMDIVCWHVHANRVEYSHEKNPYSRAMDYNVPEVPGPEGLHYRYDEVMQSAISACAEIFKNGLLKTVENPVVLKFGRRSLWDPATMEWGHAYGEYGPRILPTTYRFGTRMSVDPKQVNDQVTGRTVGRNEWETSPVKPTHQIEYNWQRGYLRFDGPGVAMYNGFFADYPEKEGVGFASGVVLSKVKISNPKGIAYPVANDELYVAFCVVSRDGRPLKSTKNALLSLVSTSFNKGFKLDHSKIVNEHIWQLNPGCMPSVGKAPVQVARVGATIDLPMFDGAGYTYLDWHYREIGKGTIKNGRLRVPENKAIYIVSLQR